MSSYQVSIEIGSWQTALRKHCVNLPRSFPIKAL